MQKDTIILTPSLQRSLLQAIRTNQLDLAPFVPLFTSTTQEPTHDMGRLSEDEKSRLEALVSRAGSKSGTMRIANRSLKVRLLQTICQQSLRPDDFPEIREACQQLRPDLSVFSREEIDFLTEIAIKSG